MEDSSLPANGINSNRVHPIHNKRDNASRIRIVFLLFLGDIQIKESGKKC